MITIEAAGTHTAATDMQYRTNNLNVLEKVIMFEILFKVLITMEIRTCYSHGLMEPVATLVNVSQKLTLILLDRAYFLRIFFFEFS